MLHGCALKRTRFMDMLYGGALVLDRVRVLGGPSPLDEDGTDAPDLELAAPAMGFNFNGLL